VLLCSSDVDATLRVHDSCKTRTVIYPTANKSYRPPSQEQKSIQKAVPKWRLANATKGGICFVYFILFIANKEFS
jgi:hypothetical protein